MSEQRTQFNLLPDVKQSNVKSQRTRRLITSTATLASVVAASLFIIMLFTVYAVQKKQLSDADKTIAEYSQKLNSTENLNDILTVQNQLSSLVDLHKNKHAASRIFDYMPAVTPSNIKLANIALDLGANTIQIDGSADFQKTVNTFVDTLKFTTYSLGGDGTGQTAFPSVVLSSFGVEEGNATFSLNVSFDPTLFSNSTVDSSGSPTTPKLNVPKLSTTRVLSNDPNNVLFSGQGSGN